MSRPKGSQNIITREVRETLKRLVASELESLSGRLDKLTNEERVNVLLRLLPYVSPKLDTVHHSEGEPLSESPDRHYTVSFYDPKETQIVSR